jgi:hypothetical protein
LPNRDVVCQYVAVRIVPAVLAAEGDRSLLEETLET